jgi:hypothetical protein
MPALASIAKTPSTSLLRERLRTGGTGTGPVRTGSFITLVTIR